MASKISVRFGRRVRVLRLKLGWRQIDLAAHADLSRKHLSAIELGTAEICLNTIEKLAGALNVPPFELLR